MGADKYYAWEQHEYMDLANVGLDFDVALRLHKKFARHFGKVGGFKSRYTGKFYPAPSPRLVLSLRYGVMRGTAYSDYRIKIGKRTTLNVLAHEWAHILNKRTGGRHHDRAFKKWHKKVVTYVRGKNYFGLLESFKSEEILLVAPVLLASM